MDNTLPLNQIITGDNAEVLKTFPDSCIDLTVTSPPYDKMRTCYNFSFDFETLARELYRVTKAGGVVVWVVNDATINGSETLTSFKQAIYFKEVCGFNLHDTMIWRKKSPMPQTKVGKRYTLSMEYMFIFSKGLVNTFNPIMEKTKTFGKDLSPLTQKSADGSKRLARLTAQIGKKVNEYRQLFNIWDIAATNEKSSSHPAPFPERLAHDHIISWSNAGDVVLDPFAGSGTTAKMSKLTGRHYIGIEISPEYVQLANNRLQSYTEACKQLELVTA